MLTLVLTLVIAIALLVLGFTLFGQAYLSEKIG